MDLGGAVFTFQHGFAWADVEVGADRLRFVATHLESQCAEVALAQAGDLLTGPAAGMRPPCSPATATPRPAPPRTRCSPSAAGSPTCGWKLARGPRSGLHRHLGELVNDPTAAGLSRRMTWCSPGPPDRAVTPARVGADRPEPADRDPPRVLALRPRWCGGRIGDRGLRRDARRPLPAAPAPGARSGWADPAAGHRVADYRRGPRSGARPGPGAPGPARSGAPGARIRRRRRFAGPAGGGATREPAGRSVSSSRPTAAPAT